MSLFRFWCASGVVFSLVLCLTTSLHAEVVINEIFYHSPNDLDDLEFVELANTANDDFDVSGWSLKGEITFSFADGASIPANGYVVVAKDGKLLREFYDIEPVGEYKKRLSNSGGKISLQDGDGNEIDVVSYKDSAPWPIAADGYSASLERISLQATSEAANWAPSKLSDDYDTKPSGTPGSKNSVAKESLGPVVSNVEFDSKRCSPGTQLEVAVKFADADSVGDAFINYQHVAAGNVGAESPVPLKRSGSDFVASVPTGEESNRLLRFHVTATSRDGEVTRYPHANEVRPTFTAYVNEEVKKDKLAVTDFFFAGTSEAEVGDAYRQSQSESISRDRFRGGFRGGPPRGFDRGGDRRGFDRGGFDRRGFGGRRGRFGGFPSTPLKPQGVGAFIYTDPETGESEVYDHVNIVQRKSGWKVRFHKDRLFHGMSTVNFLYEPDQATMVNESLAYQLYGLAGNKTYKSGFVRVAINGEAVGHHVFFEQPNGNFFRRNDINSKGDLYKLIWMGNAEMSPRVPESKRTNRPDITGRYEKKSNPHSGHQDLVAVVEELEKTDDDNAMWLLIEKNFESDQLINYFAVNSLISHWDGFFNNFFAYHDRKGTGKWSMYPWDQDSTWSQRGGRPEELYTMPVFFGAEGATPNGIVKREDRDGRDRDRRGFGSFGGRGFGRRGFGGGRGFGWWRDGGDFSRPLLANPKFYDKFKVRLGELTDTVFTKEQFGPKIDELKTLLEPEVRFRARMRKESEDEAVAELDRIVQALHEHLAERGSFVRDELAKDR